MGGRDLYAVQGVRLFWVRCWLCAWQQRPTQQEQTAAGVRPSSPSASDILSSINLSLSRGSLECHWQLISAHLAVLSQALPRTTQLLTWLSHPKPTMASSWKLFCFPFPSRYLLRWQPQVPIDPHPFSAIFVFKTSFCSKEGQAGLSVSLCATSTSPLCGRLHVCCHAPVPGIGTAQNGF